MKFATCRLADDSTEPAPKLLKQNRLHWLRFGHEYFCYNEDPTPSFNWDKVKSSGLNPSRASRGSIRRKANSLYVVSQEGRLFQQAHPDVRVLYDKGRHLVVSLDPRQARNITAHQARFSIRRAAKNQTIFETLERPAKRLKTDSRIKGVVDALSKKSLKTTLERIAAFRTRHSLSPQFQDVARQLSELLQSMGYAVDLHVVPIPGGKTLNVVADKQGLARGRRSVTLVSAHLDSVNHPADHSPDDPAAPAPGADDNGSGSAGLIEIARVLKDRSFSQDLRLILFGGEEQGLFGSKHYVKNLSRAERARIKSVVNMDMIAVLNTKKPAVLLEGGDPVSKPMMAGLSAAAHTYTKLTVNTSLRPHDSDHVPFIKAGTPAVLTIEGNDDGNKNIHNANDTLDHINYDLAMEILRMNTAFAVGEIV